ncbi:NAD(P)-dependent oxidoreductase [Aureisphaera galaxeae]|uniref:NAD(P)-dependent oxidoreductase n=1 Tax=Aureisphaera galaxeae TaxID=1538023 RepID=UPI00235030C5|nr:NAD(P)-dependent oxidoreductase [Aureisphaera galaxeae]MDC8004655.1 NAD(P)-dependent oxidoreductase [Aureisphaera galaxeae]
MKVAFLGLGIMGSRMVDHLIENKVDLTVYNRSVAATEAFVSKGTKVAKTPQEAVADADIVFSMLSTPEAVAEVFFGEGNALSAMKKNAFWADCSTVNPSFSLEAAQEAKKHHVHFLDAPVAGSKPQARAGELVFFVGGSESHVNVLMPFLDMMGKKTMRIGETGKGASFKMLVNAMLAQSMLIFSETTVLGQKMGISREFLLNVLPNLVVSAPFLQFKAPNIKEDNYEVQFPLEWMHKDLHLATLTGYEHDQPLYMANTAKEQFAEAKRAGMGRLDFSAIHKYLEEQSNV